MEPHKKQLHVTLAYNFPSAHLPSLEKLAKGIEVKLGCDWLAVLFSRDIRFASHEVSGGGQRRRLAGRDPGGGGGVKRRVLSRRR